MGRLEGWRSCPPLGGITVKFSGGGGGGGGVWKLSTIWWYRCKVHGRVGGVGKLSTTRQYRCKFMGDGEKQDASFSSWEATVILKMGQPYCMWMVPLRSVQA